MSDDPAGRELLDAAAKRATATQPDEIRLSAAVEHAWSNPAAVEAYVNPLRELGFAETGTYTVSPRLTGRVILPCSQSRTCF